MKEVSQFFEYLCDLCDPEKEGKNATLRILGLSLTNNVIEILGQEIEKFPGLLNIASNNYTRGLLRNAVTTNVLVFSQTIRGILNLISTMSPYIHEQIECFILCFLRISEAKTSSNEHQELILEMFQELFRDPEFISFLYIQYDCNEQSFDLFEGICKFLSKNSFPLKEGEPINVKQILSLQCLLNILHCISERSSDENKLTQEKILELREIKNTKVKYLQCVENINNNPQKGIKSLQDLKLIKEEFDPKEFSTVLKKYSKWFTKASVSEVMKKDQNVLREYMESFDFKGLPIDEALRLLIRNFHLLGSAEVIEKITKTFATKFYEDNKETDIFENAEAAFVYTFAVTMLHSDLHNPRNISKMKLESFIKNTQYSVNLQTKKPIPREELERVYNSLLVRKFEYENSFKDEFKENVLWENILKRSQNYLKDLVIDRGIGKHMDSDMYQLIYPKIIQAIMTILEHTEDNEILEMTKQGLLDCSKIASFYKLSTVFDHLVVSLCKFTDILSISNENSVISFGNNKKAQLATKTVFTITRNYGDNLREGWKNILDFILRLYELNLLPKNILLTESFAEEVKVYSSALEKTKRERKTPTSYSFFGFFGGEEDLESKQAEEKAKLCIENCNISDLLKDAKILHEPSLEYLVKALIFKSGSFQSKDDTILSRMFCLDLLTDVSITNKDRTSKIWSYIFDHVKNLITGVIVEFEKSQKLKQELLVVMERVIISSMRFCIRLMFLDEMKNNLNQLIILLLTPNNIPSSLFKTFLPHFCSGLNVLVTNSSKYIKDTTIWSLIIDTLRIGASNKDSRSKAVEGIIQITHDIDSINLENIPNCTQAIIMIGTSNVIDMLVNFHEKMFQDKTTLSNPSQTWCKAWLSVLEGIGKLATCTDTDIRHTSLIQLQSVFLDNRVFLLPLDLIHSTFYIILFALLDQLVLVNNVQDIEETRLRAINLLAKSFLNFLNILLPNEKMNEIWSEVLVYMKKYLVDSNKSSILAEAVPELIKNLVLVLFTQNSFKEYPKLWEITKDQLEGVMPEFLKEMTNKIEEKKE